MTQDMDQPASTNPAASVGDARAATPEPSRSRRWRRRVLRAVGITAAITVGVLASSCITIPAHNEAYPASRDEVRAAISEMNADAVDLPRPVVVVSGYRSPRTNADGLRADILRATNAGPDDVVAISYPFATTIEDPAQRVIDLVDERFPSDDETWTTEVDVVAISMGGLVARLAADAPEHRGVPEGRRLNVKRLYTLGSPHEGARLSQLIRVDQASSDMQPGSAFVTDLNARADYERYELTTYAVLHDRWVGATRSAPPGREPIWVPGRVVLSHHLMTYSDRIVADLLRRLRGELPLGEPSRPPRD
jgi:pimeloyl-ACP methyl ester carboxylesterase